MASSGPKLPVRQLTILAVARFAEPMAYTSVLAYLPEMIRDFGIEQNQVAKWVGVTMGVFSISQSIGAVPWGQASDRYGRKPILVSGLVATMICFVVWSLSASLPMAIAVRAIQGASNGNVGIIRTMVAEMVPEKELQPRAFSIMPLVWSLGSVVGPAFGGLFAQPARQYPDIFGGIAFFERFPYALPNLIAAGFFTISIASAVLFLEETLAQKREHQDWGLLVGKRLSRAFSRKSAHFSRRRSFVDGEATAPLIPSKIKHSSASSAPKGKPTMSEVFTRQSVINLVAYSFLAFHSVAYDQNLSVFLNYPLSEHTGENTRLPFFFTGGFGLHPSQIGAVFTIYAIVGAIIQFTLFPPLVTHYGVLNCLKFISIITPFVYLATPYTSLFPTENSRFAAIMFVMFFKAICVIIGFPATTILLTNSCSSLRVLGTLNGYGTMFSGLGRALGPLSTGLAFSWGVDHGYIITGHYYLAIMAVIGAIPVFMIVEGDGIAASPEHSDSDDDGGMHDSGVMMASESAVADDSDDEAGSSQPLLGDSKKTTYSAINTGRK